MLGDVVASTSGQPHTLTSNGATDTMTLHTLMIVKNQQLPRWRDASVLHFPQTEPFGRRRTRCLLTISSIQY